MLEKKQTLFLFLKKETGIILKIIGQFLYCPPYQKYLRKLYIATFINTANWITYSLILSGYKPNDSTVNQLTLITHKLYKALDQKQNACMVFLDVSKAFDKVWHNGLIFKLKRFGITGILVQEHKPDNAL